MSHNLKQFGDKQTKYNVPRMAYVNKMDIMGADFFRVVEMMRERLNANAVPIQLPIGKEEDFLGIIDLIRNVAEVYKDDLGTHNRRNRNPRRYERVSRRI